MSTIDRQAAINVVKDIYKGVYPEDAEGWIIKGLENLPSIQSERKKGHWIVEQPNGANGFKECYRCSECNYLVGRREKFCPNCGADMRGEQ